MEKEPLEPGNYYHIYNRGNNKETIFIEEKNYNYFLNLLKKYVLPIADIYAYCLLKNHFHILLKIKDIEKLPEKYKSKVHVPFSNLFNTYTKSINKAYDRTGSLFQEHLKRNKINDENYLMQLVIYIHLNPMKHGFCEDFKTYKHSSYLSYISDKKSSLDRNFIFTFFGDKENFIFTHNQKQAEYKGLMDEINKDDF
jgi:putative transposase